MSPIRKTVIISIMFALVFSSLTVGAIMIGNNQETIPITFVIGPTNSISINAELARTPKEWQQGLMNRITMEENTGMLFMFPDEAPRRFWMKNTLIPLDMLFLDSHHHLIAVHRNVQPCTADPCPTYPSNYPAQFVIELPAGFVDKQEITNTTIINF